MADDTDESDGLQRLREISGKLVDMDPDLFQQIIDALPDALLIADAQSKILLVNKQLELMFGWPRTMLMGQRLDMLMPEEVRTIHKAHFDDYFMNPSARPMNMGKHLTGLRRDGRLVTVQISLGPIISPQGTWGLALIRRAIDGK